MKSVGEFIKKAITFWVIGYSLTVIIRALAIYVVGLFLKIPLTDETHNISNTDGYQFTTPFRFVWNLVVWYFGAYYFLKSMDTQVKESVKSLTKKVALIWLGLTILTDYVLWVALPIPMQMTFHQRYVQEGLWHLLTYLSIVVGTYLGAREVIRKYIDAKR